jgi:hypothetical protein
MQVIPHQQEPEMEDSASNDTAPTASDPSDDSTTRPNRRRFLGLAGAGAGAAVVAEGRTREAHAAPCRLRRVCRQAW